MEERLKELEREIYLLKQEIRELKKATQNSFWNYR
mgnify:CR=1 FL=1